MSRVLIVDDEADFLEAAKWLLEGLGHLCFTFHYTPDSAELFWEVVAEKRPDLVILDVRLNDLPSSPPGLDGVSLFEELKRRPGRHTVLFTSAHRDYGEDYLCRRGAIGFMDKGLFAEDIARFMSLASHPRALLVDDDPAFLESASGALAPVNCLCVSDWRALQQHLDDWDFSCFDVILVDALLDENSQTFHGWHLVRHIRHILPSARVYFLTDKDQLRIAGAAGGPLSSGAGTREALLARLIGAEVSSVFDKATSWPTEITALLEGTGRHA